MPTNNAFALFCLGVHDRPFFVSKNMKQENQEARENLTNFFYLLWKIDQRLKKEKQDERNKKHN